MPVKPANAPVGRAWTLFLIVVIGAFNTIDRQIIGVLGEPIRHELGLSDTQLGLLTGLAFAIFYATFGIPLALIAQRGNRRTVISICLAIFSLTSAASGLATNFFHLLLARIGTAVGEAGTMAPSHSIISDLYDRSERPKALGLFGISHALGPLVGFIVGGWVAQQYGWRAAFLIVGLPGVIVALLFQLTTREPVRGGMDERRPSQVQATLVETVRYLVRRKAYRNTVAAYVLVSFTGFAVIFWTGAYLTRIFGLSVFQVGLAMALSIGLLGAIGSYVAGLLATYAAARDTRWVMWIPAVAFATAVPLAWAFFLAPTPMWAMAFAIWPSFIINCAHGPSYSTMQSTIPVRMRVLSSAIGSLVTMLLGLGLGPLAAGVASDVARAVTGTESIRLSLVLCSTFLLWAAFHFWRAGIHLAGDLEDFNDPADQDAAAEITVARGVNSPHPV